MGKTESEVLIVSREEESEDKTTDVKTLFKIVKYDDKKSVLLNSDKSKKPYLLARKDHLLKRI